jgi:hypothetical protein
VGHEANASAAAMRPATALTVLAVYPQGVYAGPGQVPIQER